MKKEIRLFFMILTLILLIASCKTTRSTLTNTTTSTSTTTTIETTTTKDVVASQWFNLNGFAKGYISDRSHKRSTDDDYRVVNNEFEFLTALSDFNVRVIEIASDLNLGFEELKKQFNVDQFSSVVKRHNTPLLHPTLLETGVSKITIQDRNEDKNRKSLLIFSKTGHTIKHASFIIKRSEDIVFRNLKFAELWEFDEVTFGNYDRNDWDYFTIEDSNGCWLDHLEFGKSYDGLVDLKEGSRNVTISWSKFSFEPEKFIYDQFAFLELDKDKYPMYKHLRDGGLSIEEIVKLYSSQKKGHLVGSSELEESNKDLTLTIHHNVYFNLQDRLPRIRAGNVHVYNVILDNSFLLRTSNELSRYNNVLKSSQYKFGINNQGIITTENGAVMMEDSIFRGVKTPIKNNQKNTEQRYTGKYQVINSIYELSTIKFIGGSEDINTQFVASPVPPIPFSWNGFTELPYNYQKIDVNSLEEFLLEKVGIQKNSEINWLKINEVEE